MNSERTSDISFPGGELKDGQIPPPKSKATLATDFRRKAAVDIAVRPRLGSEQIGIEQKEDRSDMPAARGLVVQQVFERRQMIGHQPVRHGKIRNRPDA